MKILKLLNKKFFSIIVFLLFSSFLMAEEQPVDIWNIDKKKIDEISQSNNLEIENIDNSENGSQESIYKMQSTKKKDTIELDQTIASKNIKILGLYDPEDNGLDINIWDNSDGDQLKRIFSKISKIDLSDDATEIMKISMLTNAYSPKKNITNEEFLKFKSDWLIKNSDLDLIEDYYIKNEIINIHPELIKYLVNEYLSEAKIDKACEVFSKNSQPIQDDYLSKFNLYCLIKSNKKEQAQLIFDLKKELGFNDEYFENKISYLLGYSSKIDESISEKTILAFHLAHITNPNFSFNPKNTTDKIIWKYLAASNLLNALKEIDISDLEKISTIENAAHNKNYPEKDLLDIYKRFQFSINQLLNVKEISKTLSNIESRALIYQKILLESENVEKLKLLRMLKGSFKKDNISNAFDTELKKFLKKMDPLEIPDNLTSFYYTNIKIEKEEKQKIKYNNDILHQSKLLNYFKGGYSKSKIEKDVNNFLKKISKNKKYFFSKKDIIFLEALKSDGINIEKKYENFYKINPSEIPTDIQVMVNNNEKGATLLRIAEVIGQDNLDRIDEDTIYFIISALNQLEINIMRNKILLKVLPLKV
tara:strand:+ start:193 stop:1965 length:1773 start_codon:yes stop_codon:yes gene_type:complete